MYASSYPGIWSPQKGTEQIHALRTLSALLAFVALSLQTLQYHQRFFILAMYFPGCFSNSD